MLRDRGQDLHEYLIATAARLIAERGTAGLAVRDIARAAQVADGVLYNYFEDKEDLLANALLAHVASAMSTVARMPEPGTGTVAGNLESFIENGLAVLTRVMPAFAGLVTQPNVLTRFRAMVGGSRAFGSASQPGERPEEQPGEPAVFQPGERPEGQPGEPAVFQPGERPEEQPGESPGGGTGQQARPAGAAGPSHLVGGQGLPAILTEYLRGEQRVGRVDAGADVDAAVVLIVGAIHGEILPPLLLHPGGGPPVIKPGLAGRLATTLMAGLTPG